MVPSIYVLFYSKSILFLFLNQAPRNKYTGKFAKILHRKLRNFIERN